MREWLKYFIPIYGLVELSTEDDDDCVDDQIAKCLKFIGLLIYNTALMMFPIKLLTEEYEDLAKFYHPTDFSFALAIVVICVTFLIIKGGIALINYMRSRLYDKNEL